MLFSSREPFNDDPEPYECNMKHPGEQRHSEDDVWACMASSREPRPEYDRPPHNPTNPILAEFRRSAPWDIPVDAALELGWLDTKPIPETATYEQIEHARKVLTRLSELT